MYFSKRLAQLYSKLKEEIKYQWSGAESPNDLTPSESAFFHENSKKWSRDSKCAQTGHILIEGILADYGPNYLYRTGLITQAIREKHPELTPVVLYNQLLQFHRKSIYLYRSFGFTRFYSPNLNLINQLCRIQSKIIGAVVSRKIRTGEQLLDLSFRGIHIGDLIYDSITSNLKQYKTIDVVSDDMKVYIYRAIHEIIVYERIFKKFDVKFLVSTHPCYVTYGTLCRVALKHGARVLMTTDIEVVELEKNHNPEIKWTPVFHEFVSKYVRKKIEKIQDIDGAILDSKKYLEERLLGKIDQVDVQLAYRSKSEYSEEALRKRLDLDVNRPIVFIFAHIIADAPHCSHSLLFKDYYVWLKETLKICKEIPDVYWLVKAHPAAKVYSEEGIVESLVLDCDSNHIKVVPSDYNTNSAFQYAHSLITVNGTAGLEFSCFGVPVILAGRPFYSEWGITHDPKDLPAYKTALKEINKIQKLSSEQTGKALTILSAFRSYSISDNKVLTSELLMKVWGYKQRDIDHVFSEMAKNLALIDPKTEPQYLRAKEILN